MRLGTAVCAIAMFAASLSAQPAAEVKCGMLVVSNLTLTTDLSCPSLGANGAALIVMKNGVHLDLNGHAVVGGGTGAGIVVIGADDVRISNGEIRDFGMGLMATSAGVDRCYTPVLQNLRFSGNGIGAYLDGVQFGQVSASEFSDSKAFGLVLFNGTAHTVVSDNLIYANARDGIAVGCDPWTKDPKAGSPFACAGWYSEDNTLEGNTVIANGWTKGTAADGLAGIILMFANRTTVRDNLVIDNNTIPDGGQLNVTSGVAVTAGSDNVIVHNRVSNNGKGILLTAHPSVPAAPGSNGVVSGNTVLHNASSGIMVFGEDNAGATVSDNTAIANGWAEKTGWPTQCRSGIRLQGTGGTLIGNRAYDNLGYGLHVEAKDLKAEMANRAMRNGEPAGCLGITCQ